MNQPFQIGETHSYSSLEFQHGGHVTQWSGQQLVALQVEAVPASLSAVHKEHIQPKINRVCPGMSEKESGAEVSHSRLAEVSGIGSQQYLYKKQFKSKKGMSILHD